MREGSGCAGRRGRAGYQGCSRRRCPQHSPPPRAVRAAWRARSSRWLGRHPKQRQRRHLAAAAAASTSAPRDVDSQLWPYSHLRRELHEERGRSIGLKSSPGVPPRRPPLPPIGRHREAISARLLRSRGAARMRRGPSLFACSPWRGRGPPVRLPRAAGALPEATRGQLPRLCAPAARRRERVPAALVQLSLPLASPSLLG
mmetsp:Transcript_57695/g.114540  ORF Transcript_57695/g.114540 Transcript_57695/m.114540 type:complete len:201 (-) Transcript_57695:813-1415(-)